MREWFKRSSVVALVSIAWTVPRAAADEAAPEAPTADPVLAALVQEALAKSPDLRAAAEIVEAAQARPAQAGALADPMVAIAYVNDGWAATLGEREMTTLGVMASQDLPWPGKRSLRARIAARDADEEVQQLARARLGVTAAVRRSYHALQLSRVRRAIAREQAQLGLEVEGAARARYAVGQGSQTDVLRALIEATRVRQIEIEQAAEETVREAELNRLLGRLPEASVNTAPLAMFPLREPFEVVLERLRALSPERAAAHAAVERARLSVSLAGKDFRPDFTVGAGYMNRGGLDPMWQVAVGIRLPLSRARRHSALREAEARQRAAEARAAAVDRQLQFRTQERLARLAAVERMTALYEGGVVAQDRIAVEAALAGYRSGRTAFLSVLAALGTLYGDRATVARLHAAHGALCATLEEASLDGIVDVPGLPAAMDGAAMGPPAMDVPATPARARGSTVAADPNMDR